MESERKEKMDLDDEQRRQKLIEEQVCWCIMIRICVLNIFLQIKRDKERGIEAPEPVYTELVRKDEEEKGIEFLFSFKFIIIVTLILVQVTFNQMAVAEKKKTLA